MASLLPIILCTVTPSILASGRSFAYVAHHPLEGRAHHLLILEFERHAADIGFVRDIGREDFEHHRIADLARDVDGLIGRSRPA